MTKVTTKKDTLAVDYKAIPRTVIDDYLEIQAAQESITLNPDPMEVAQAEHPMNRPQAVTPDNLWQDGAAEQTKPTFRAMAKPVYTPFQWFVDKLLTGEQVTAAMYRHYQMSRADRDQKMYPVQEFDSYWDAAKKGFLHKTEWNFMDIAKYEDWFGATPVGAHLKKVELAAVQMLENPESTPEQKKEAYKVIKRVKGDLAFGNSVAGLAGGVVLDPITYMDPSKVRAVSKVVKAPVKFAHQKALTNILGYNELTARLDEITKLVFTGGKSYRLKRLEGISDAIVTLRKSGVQEDVIKALDEGTISASDVIASLRPTVEGYDEIVSALARLAAGEGAVGEIAEAVAKMQGLADVSVAMEKGDSRQLAKQFLTVHRLDGTYEAHRALGRGKEGRAVLDLFETAEVTRVARSAGGTLDDLPNFKAPEIRHGATHGF